MSKANLSVIITCFNKEKYINECVQSVLDQTIQPLEIILVHDGCVDPAHHPHTSTLILPKNTGVAQARNAGYRYSKGSLVLFLDGDDKISPDFIEKCVWQMKKSDIAYPNILLWYEDLGRNKFVASPTRLYPKDMYRICKIPVTCVMKRDVYSKLGGFRVLPIYEDWDFWLRALAAGYKFGKVNSFIWYRQYVGTRNRQTTEMKEQAYKKIRSQFEIKKGKLCPSQNTKT